MKRVRDLDRLEEISAEAVDRLLAEHRFPHVEGRTATFVWRGEADRVLLRHWIYGLPASLPFRRIGASDLWTLQLDVPRRSRVEYKIDVVRGGRHRWVRDPLNRRIAHDPFGANSVLHGAGYRTPGWTQPDPGVVSGTLSTLELRSRALASKREVQVYRPAGAPHGGRHPLLILHDGSDYLRYAGLSTVLDNLIARNEIEPLVVALVDSPRRLREFAADPDHARFVVKELLPALEEELPLAPQPATRAIGGASFGAVAALACAWEYPGTFGRLLLQSGSFAFSDLGDRHERGPAFDPVVAFMRQFRRSPGSPATRVFMSCGVYESLIYENRSLVPLLQSAVRDLRFVEARDGHNWENWRDRLREGLSWLFPGALWMVYD
ncbi:MAG: alpha/beta hydrolase-fold protein [Thermoanaerobaculia bacterium]|nr:alpha/beta hydrolase-fold protein [Thermoanaerobaculia bacterium]